jgi:4-amino-4-deoxychorismate lyase
MTLTLVNGEPAESIPADDRGLNYGDGVFRTLAIRAGCAAMWRQHYAKLASDCTALRIAAPAESDLLSDVAHISSRMPDCALRITVTRGSGGRGYAMPATVSPRRIVSASSLPDYPEQFAISGVNVRYCEQRLATQPSLAGIKHLNRLENVLARAEWNDPEIAEGLLCDSDDNVIEGTRCNLFLVEGGGLVTPDLSRCGVAGVMRDAVIMLASQHGMPCRIESVSRSRMAAASEVMLVNSIIGIWPVARLERHEWRQFPVAMRLQQWLDAYCNATD